MEFDAFDKLSKEYEPKASQRYPAAAKEYSRKAFEAADRELGLFIFGVRRQDVVLYTGARRDAGFR